MPSSQRRPARHGDCPPNRIKTSLGLPHSVLAQWRYGCNFGRTIPALRVATGEIEVPLARHWLL